MKTNSLLYLSKIIVGISICCFFFCPVSSAQVDSTKSAPASNAISHGKWAVDFRLGQFFSRGNYNDIYINGKYYWTRNIMTRISFDMSISSSLGHPSTYYEHSSGQNLNYSFIINEYLSSNDKIVLSNYFMHFVNPDKNVLINMGIGPFIGVSFAYNWNLYRYSQGYSDRRTSRNRTIDLGFSGIIGAEWFIRKWLSLSAEYGAIIYFRDSELVEKDLRYNGAGIRNQHEYNLEIQDFVIGFSVYF